MTDPYSELWGEECHCGCPTLDSKTVDLEDVVTYVGDYTTYVKVKVFNDDYLNLITVDTSIEAKFIFSAG
jgi:hypothetical protein